MNTDLVRPLIEQLRFLHEMGVQELRLPAAAPAAVTEAAGARPDRPGAEAALAAVRAELGDCTRCELSASRTRLVFGVGHPAADLMFVGEAPGRDEDLKGEPFVGRAGQLLDKMIASIGMQRAEVYIANVVKCRPPGNRNPGTEEIATCRPFLAAQIDAIAPRVIVTLGKFAASVLLGEAIAITRCRGQLRDYRGIPLMPTFHPAYLLRQYTPQNRRAVYEDLLQVKAILESSGSPAHS